MYKLRLRENRGKTKTEWLDSFHTFSFAQYFDLFNMGFSDLRVINDDIFAPESGTTPHSHANMEIVNIVLQGELEYSSSSKNKEILHAGDIMAITAGSGITHMEYNPSSDKVLHMLQIWILPNKKGLEPKFSKKTVEKSEMKNELKLIVSGDGRENSLKIHQDASIYQAVLEADRITFFEMQKNRKFWIQVVKGAIEVNSNILEAGDGISIVNEYGLLELSGVDFESNFLLFDLRNLTF